METTYKMNAQDLGAGFVASVQSVYLDRNIEITIREAVATEPQPSRSSDKDVSDDSWFEKGEPCPICAKHRDPVTGNPRYNAETIAGMQEVEDMISGKIPVTWHTSLDDLDEMLGL